MNFERESMDRKTELDREKERETKNDKKPLIFCTTLFLFSENKAKRLRRKSQQQQNNVNIEKLFLYL